MSAIARAGQRADDLVLTKAVFEPIDGEKSRLFDGAIDEDNMFLCIDVRDFTVISIIAAAFSDKAIQVE